MTSDSLLDVTQIAPGLWRWTGPHPEWTPEKDKPGGWGQMVASVFVGPPASAEAIVLVDPLVPPAETPEARKFWAALDRDVEKAALPVVVFIANGYHARSALEVQQRYAGRHGAEVLAHADAAPRLGLQPTLTFGVDGVTRGGAEAVPIEGLDAGETAIFIREGRVLVLADAVLGAGGGRLAVAPESWAAEGEAARATYRKRFRPSLRRLLEALAAALAGPAWGE
jgi:glyoxylase-like metal-dependent hydrolase (beta-lactamase superfamily II)